MNTSILAHIVTLFKSIGEAIRYCLLCYITQMPWIYHADHKAFFFEPTTARRMMRQLYPQPVKNIQATLSARIHYQIAIILRLFFSKPVISTIIGWLQKSRLTKPAIIPFQQSHLADLPTPALHPENFSNFNSYFQRRLSECEGNRSLDAQGQQSTTCASPCDARTLFFEIDHAQKSTHNASWCFKGEKFNLAQLLGLSSNTIASLNQYPQRAEADQKKHKTQVICQRLCPFDYHHIHAPMDCHIQEITWLKGPLFSVHPSAIATKAQYFFQNQRLCLTLKAAALDLTFFLVAIGATAVGSIELLCRKEARLTKGDLIASFACGGSSTALVIPNSPLVLEKKFQQAIAKIGPGLEIFTHCHESLLVQHYPSKLDASQS